MLEKTFRTMIEDISVFYIFRVSLLQKWASDLEPCHIQGILKCTTKKWFLQKVVQLHHKVCSKHCGELGDLLLLCLQKHL